MELVRHQTPRSLELSHEWAMKMVEKTQQGDMRVELENNNRYEMLNGIRSVEGERWLNVEDEELTGNGG